MTPISILQETTRPKVNFFGTYKAIVEDINDPLQQGRLRVRVPDIYGPIENVPTKALPWALPCLPFGNGSDFGSFCPPPVGTYVFVQFEHGRVEFPIVMGSWPGVRNTEQQYLRNSDNSYPTDPVSMSPDVKTTWKGSLGPEAPFEALRMVNHRPERYVPFKSPKGATIDIEDRDEVEHTAIVDRAGQGLHFDAPITKADNEGNASQRGLQTALEADPLPLEATVSNEGSVVLIDLGGQSVTLHTKAQSNNIRVISKQGFEDAETGALISGNKETDGASNVNMELSSGDNVFCLEIKNEGKTQSKILIDGNSGQMELVAPMGIKISSDSLVLDGDLIVSGNTYTTQLLATKNVLSGGEVLGNRTTQKYSLRDAAIVTI